MARRKLTPRQGRILWMLSEAHEEDLSTVLNTEQPAPTAAGLAEIETALLGLLAMGLIDVGQFVGSPRTFEPRDRSLLRAALAEHGPFEWVRDAEAWIWHGALVGLDGELSIVLTPAGEAALEE